MSEVFEFTAENLAQAKDFIGRYPEGRQRSAVMPLLDLAQRQNGGWLPEGAVATIAEMLDMAPIRVLEVVTFYSMYNQSPVGKHQINVCTTTPCWLRGSDEVVGACRNSLGIGVGETTSDGAFSLGEVECLGACVNAPVVQVDDDYYEDVDSRSMASIIDALKRGDRPAAGSQTGRTASAPEGGPLTLTGEIAKPAGKKAGKNVDAVEVDEAEAVEPEIVETEAVEPEVEATDIETGEAEAVEPEVVETEAVQAEDDEAAGDEPRTKKE
jgi:NADH-quinone oxidoreductase E subunit